MGLRDVVIRAPQLVVPEAKHGKEAEPPYCTMPLRLHDHYKALHDYRSTNAERACERIQDAVRQLVEARKSIRMSSQLKGRRETLLSALEESLRWCPTARLKADEVGNATTLIDEAIVNYITKRQIESISHNGHAL